MNQSINPLVNSLSYLSVKGKNTHNASVNTCIVGVNSPYLEGNQQQGLIPCESICALIYTLTCTLRDACTLSFGQTQNTLSAGLVAHLHKSDIVHLSDVNRVWSVLESMGATRFDAMGTGTFASTTYAAI